MEMRYKCVIIYTHNKRYTMKNLPRIYLDMDGVLVNFEKQLEDTIKMLSVSG